MMPEIPVQPGGVIADKYEIERAIVQVGAGPVLIARHRQLDQRVAIELLRGDASQPEELAERLRRHARAAALRGEHVCRVVDVCAAADGTPCVVTEYADGPDLATELTSRGCLPHAEAVEYALQACEGLAEALAIGLAHGALRPELVYLTTRRDGSRCVKLLGIGAALEQVTPASDVRALGELLQEMLGSEAVPDALLEVVRAARAAQYASIAELAQALVPFAGPRGRVSAERVSRLVTARVSDLPPRAVPEPKPRVSRRLCVLALVPAALLAALVGVQRPQARVASEAPAQQSRLEPRPPEAPLLAVVELDAAPEPSPDAGALRVRVQPAPLGVTPPPSAAGRMAPAPRVGVPDFGGRR